MKLKVFSPSAAARIGIFAASIGLLGLWCLLTVVSMPGENYQGPDLELSEDEREVADKLRQRIDMLCATGGRHFQNPTGLKSAERGIFIELKKLGYDVWMEAVPAPTEIEGAGFHNIIAERRGSSLAPEAFAGPHDYLNSFFFYDENGDISEEPLPPLRFATTYLQYYSLGLLSEKRAQAIASDAINYGNVVLSAPLVAASVLFPTWQSAGCFE